MQLRETKLIQTLDGKTLVEMTYLSLPDLDEATTFLRFRFPEDVPVNLSLAAIQRSALEDVAQFAAEAARKVIEARGRG
jgi:hypothetical protein